MADFTTKPASLEQCFQFLLRTLEPTLINDIRTTSRENTWQLHFSLSPIIEAEILNGNTELNTRLEKSAFCDDPNIADQIGIAFWDHLQSSQ